MFSKLKIECRCHIKKRPGMRYFGLRRTFLNILIDSFFNISRWHIFHMCNGLKFKYVVLKLFMKGRRNSRWSFFLLLLHLRTYLTIFRFSSCVGGGERVTKWHTNGLLFNVIPKSLESFIELFMWNCLLYMSSAWNYNYVICPSN